MSHPEAPLPRASDRQRVHRRIQRRTLFVSGTAVLALFAAGALFAQSAREYDRAVSELADELLLQRTLREVLQLVIDGETAHRGYLLTHDPAFLQPIAGRRRKLPETLRSLEAQLATKGERARAERLIDRVRHRTEWTDENVQLAREGRFVEAQARVETGEGLRRTREVRAAVRDVEGARGRELRRLRGRIDRARTTTAVALAALLAFALGLSAFVILATRRDLRMMDRTTRSLEESERRFRSLAERAPDLICVVEPDGSVSYASAAARPLLGRDPEALIGRDIDEIVHADDRELLRAARDAALRGEQPAPVLHRAAHEDGSIRSLETAVEAVHDDSEQIARIHTTSRDATTRVEREHALRSQAEEDELTGLFNRRGLLTRGAALLADARARGRSLALIFCDVDGLKTINDTLGHEEGDRVLVDAASLLRSTSRSADLVARLGGDEFAILGVADDEAGAARFGARLRERMRAHNETQARRYRISISVGVTLVAPEDTRSLDALLAAADAAMYEEKRGRRGVRMTRSGQSFIRGEDE